MENRGIRAALVSLKIKRDAGEVAPPEMNWIRKAKAHPNSLRLAVNANCYACVGGTESSQPDPGWREIVRSCTAEDTCPLHQHRPIKNEEGTDEDSE